LACLSREIALDTITPIDLSANFQGYGPLPSAAGTIDQTGGWDDFGQPRTVLPSDGCRARAELTGYDRPRRFSYPVSGFAGPLGWLPQKAYGEWWFKEGGQSGTTRVRSAYTFESQTLVGYPALRLVGRILRRRYLQRTLDRAWAMSAAHGHPIIP